MTDQSPVSARSFRIGIFIAAYYVSTPIGRGLAGQLNVQYGFINCYILCILLYIISLLIVTFFLSELGQPFYADDVEKTNSIKRALTLYDKVSISSAAAKSEDDRNAGSHRNVENIVKHAEEYGSMDNTEMDFTDKVEKSIHVEDLNRIDIACIEKDKIITRETWDDCEYADLKDKQMKDVGEIRNNTDKSRLENVIENNSLHILKPDASRDQVVVSTISQNIVFESKSLNDSEWKQVPKSSKLKAKKKWQFYNAYAEGKRPPLPDEKEKKPRKEGSLLMAFYSLYESWKVLFRSRSGNRTAILVVMIFTSPLLVAPMVGK